MTSLSPRTFATTSLGALAFALVLAAPRLARASDPPDRGGVYGRLRADTAFSIEAGGGVALANGDARGAVVATARARYLDMMGPFVSYQYAFGTPRADAIALGLDFRPLFIARTLSDLEHGPRAWDLTLDSLGLELGGAFLRPGDDYHAGSGFAFVLGGGFDVPLWWSEGSGLFLRASVRWVHALASDAQGPGVTTDTVLFALSLGGRTMARLGLVGAH
jgi:hypothetical protein